MSRKTRKLTALRQHRVRKRGYIIAVVLALAGSLAFVCLPKAPHQDSAIEPFSTPRTISYTQLLATPIKQVADIDPAELSLICSQGIEQEGELLDLNKYKAQLDAYSAQVKRETERNLYKFRKDPAAYENSEAKFRMVMMGVVLCEDFGVHYNQKQTKTYQTASTAEFFFDWQPAFIRGPMDPKIGGNCGSLPVLYAAISRRLGYPIKMVATQAHLYLQWDSPAEKFNIETALDRGIDFYSDEYFWKRDQEISGRTDYNLHDAKVAGLFRPLTAREEAAIAFHQRALCLIARGRLEEAIIAAGIMTQLSPTVSNKKFTGRLNLATLKVDERFRHPLLATPKQNRVQLLPQ